MSFLKRISILITLLKTRVFAWSKNAYWAHSRWWIFFTIGTWIGFFFNVLFHLSNLTTLIPNMFLVRYMAWLYAKIICRLVIALNENWYVFLFQIHPWYRHIKADCWNSCLFEWQSIYQVLRARTGRDITYLPTAWWSYYETNFSLWHSCNFTPSKGRWLFRRGL